MSSQANKEQFLKQFEQIVDGVKQNKNKVKLQTWNYFNLVAIFKFFLIEFYRIYRICRILLLVILKMKMTKNNTLQIWKSLYIL